jgi:hypothetical protein
MNCARPPDIDALRAGVATMSDWVLGECLLLAQLGSDQRLLPRPLSDEKRTTYAHAEFFRVCPSRISRRSLTSG